VDLGIIALRIIHIGSAILWAGGSVFIERFVQPTAEELGSNGEQFMSAMVRRRKAVVYFPVVAGLTVVAGGILYWIDSAGNPLAYLTGGGQGTGFGIGGIAGFLAFLAGTVGVGPNVAKLTKATEAMATSGSTPELEAAEAAARANLHRAGRIGLVLLTIAILSMASARYL
jgi:uncharacterized membrane protein